MPDSGAHDEERHDGGSGVAPLLPLDHAEGQASQERGAEEETRVVDPAPLAVGRLGHEDCRQHEGDGAEAQVEPEDGPPAREPHQCARDDRPQGQGEARDGRPHPQRVGSGLAVGVDVADDRQGAGLAGGSADPHDDATDDQPIDIARQRAHHGPGAEDRHSGEHDALAAKDVAQHPGRQHEAGEGERVAVHHPLQGGDARVQVALDVGQPDADDRVVEEGEEEDGAQDRQGDRLRRRAQAPLLDLQPRGCPVVPLGLPAPCAQHRAPGRDGAPGCSGTQVTHRSFTYPRCG